MNKQQFDVMAAMSSSSMKKPIEANKQYRAKVVDVKDPKKCGRVKVWIPDLMYNNVSENDGCWAMPGNSPFTSNKDSSVKGGQDCGSLIIPPNESYVWIVFEDGDFDKPRYTGGINLSVDDSVPVENQSGKEYYNKWTILKSPKGRQILISDDPDDESIIIRGKQKSRGGRTKSSDPRQPEDSMYFQLWEKAGEECAMLKDSKGQFILLDTAKDRIRVQHVSGSYIEFTSGGDIIIQAKNNVHINSFSADKENHL